MADSLRAAGRAPALARPYVAGAEFSGVVVAAGASVTHVAPGDRVVGLALLGGAFAAEIVLAAAAVHRVPPGLSLEAAAAVPVAYATAHLGLLHHGGLRASETVLVMAATSAAVGLAAVDVAKRIARATVRIGGGVVIVLFLCCCARLTVRRSQVIAVAAGPANAALLTLLGADHVLDLASADLP